MNTNEASFRRWTRRHWRPGQEIKHEWEHETWGAIVIDECNQILANRIVEIEPEVILRITGYTSHQQEAIYRLYSELYPQLLTFQGAGYIRIRPRCNEKTYLFIREQFIKLDRIHHPEVMPGGLWFQQGFDIDDTLADWQVFIPAQPEACIPNEKEADETEVSHPTAARHLCNADALA